ncbi:MAG: DUF2461 domain-containing protein [Deltaproteobacteria bacterium]|nr:DUF2461 domain-containing protein [Deltaproteobacteria bacterium]
MFQFLRELAANNDRAWFEAQRARYESAVKGPLLSFIGDFAGELAKISPNFVADPRPSGGSMFRIYRDTRFAKDKSPYKTHAAAHFRHASAKDVHAPGFYLHLAPEECLLGVGIWQPDSPTLGKIRDGIVSRPKDYERATESLEKKGWALRGESLTRVPRGYAVDHPLADALKRKDHTAMINLDSAEVTGPGFLELVAKSFKEAHPYAAFLAQTLGLEA